MIRIFLFGRLGHQLFQYAIGRHLAIKNNTELILYPSEGPESQGIQKNILGRFNIKAKYVNTHWSKLIKETGIWKLSHKNIYWESGHAFEPKVLECAGNWTLRGDFQSDKYFKDIANELRNELTINDITESGQLKVILDKIRNTNSVSINVRRGDYIGLKIFDVTNLQYYSNAIKYVKSKIQEPVFYVFSDDINWCKENLKGEEFVFSDVNDRQYDPLNDMYLMQHCRHNIITNSTYSWWSAWLNDNPEKLVLSPYKWFNSEDVPLKDKICKDWIPIDF